MAEYLVLISADEKRGLSKEDEEKCVTAYGRWAQTLGQKLLSARRLELTEGTLLKSKRNPVTDGPFAEAKELIAGFILIDASSDEEANKIAASCPLIDYFKLYVKKVAE